MADDCMAPLEILRTATAEADVYVLRERARVKLRGQMLGGGRPGRPAASRALLVATYTSPQVATKSPNPVGGAGVS